MNQPPRASNQVSLWYKSNWVAGKIDKRPPIGAVAQSVFTVDKAIKRMMESAK